MTENEHNGTGIIIFGVGALLGAFMAYLIMRKREQQTAPATMAPHPYAMQPVMIPPPVPQMPEIRTVQVPVIPSQEPEAVQALENEETWELKKDKRGRLDSIIIHRKVMRIEQ